MFKIKIDCYVRGLVYSSVYGDFICCLTCRDRFSMKDNIVSDMVKHSKYLTYTIVDIRTFDELGDYCRDEVRVVYAIVKEHFESIIIDMAERSTTDWLKKLYKYSCKIDDSEMRRICFDELIYRNETVVHVME